MKRLLIAFAALAILAGEPAVAASGPALGMPRARLAPLEEFVYQLGQVLGAAASRPVR